MTVRSAWRQAAIEWVVDHPNHTFTCQELAAEISAGGTPPGGVDKVSTFLSSWAIGRIASAPKGLHYEGPCSYSYQRRRQNKPRGIQRGGTSHPAPLPDLLEYLGVRADGSAIYRGDDDILYVAKPL